MNNIFYADEVIVKNFQQLEVEVFPEQNTVWLYFNPRPRSCFTLTLLRELAEFQSVLDAHEGSIPFKGELIDIDYNVIASRQPVFSFGGDLEYFINCMENNDREALRKYAGYCIDAVYFNHIGRNFDITTISLVQGSALGGGFEAALSSDVLIAESSSKMGLPEILFNLFPGMGAYQLLSRKTGFHIAEKIMSSGRFYRAEELRDMNIIDIVVEDGQGRLAVNNYIRGNNKCKNAMKAIRRVGRLVNPVSYQQLQEVGDIWVDTAFKLEERDIRLMRRLINSQVKTAMNWESAAMPQANIL